jgi:hypothetical protein
MRKFNNPQINIPLKRLNGRVLSKILLEQGFCENEDTDNYYFHEHYFDGIKEDSYFKIKDGYAVVNKNKLWSW